MNYVPFICLVLGIAGITLSYRKMQADPKFGFIWEVPFVSSSIVTSLIFFLNIVYYFFLPIK